MNTPKVIGTTINYEQIPDDHECSACGKGKTETSFSVTRGVHVWIVRNMCMKCKNQKHKDSEGFKRISLARKKERRIVFVDKWKEMKWD